jgi:hypothetical protein
LLRTRVSKRTKFALPYILHYRSHLSDQGYSQCEHTCIYVRYPWSLGSEPVWGDIKDEATL